MISRRLKMIEPHMLRPLYDVVPKRPGRPNAADVHPLHVRTSPLRVAPCFDFERWNRPMESLQIEVR
jgi:hypothetical protein